MGRYSEGYFENIKQGLNEARKTNDMIARVNADRNAKRNQSILKIVKGVPMRVNTDAFGSVLNIEVCNDMSYKTRNEIYLTDKLVYEKYCRGDFRHANVDIALSTSIKGQDLETALKVLDDIR